MVSYYFKLIKNTLKLKKLKKIVFLFKNLVNLGSLMMMKIWEEGGVEYGLERRNDLMDPRGYR